MSVDVDPADPRKNTPLKFLCKKASILKLANSPQTVWFDERTPTLTVFIVGLFFDLKE